MLVDLDAYAIDWLNTVGAKQAFDAYPDKPMREKLRDKLTADARIVLVLVLVLVLCYGGLGKRILLSQDIAMCLNVAVDGWREQVLYPRTRQNGRFIGDRATTSIGNPVKGADGKKFTGSSGKPKAPTP